MLKLRGFAFGCCALFALLLAAFFAFSFIASSSIVIRSDDMALFSGSMSSGLVVVSLLSGTLCSEGALACRPLRRDFLPAPRDCFWGCCWGGSCGGSWCCCCLGSPWWGVFFCFVIAKDCLFSWIDICCCPVAATAAALAATTLDGLVVATSFSSESDVESESESDVELCLILRTNLSSPAGFQRFANSGVAWFSGF